MTLVSTNRVTRILRIVPVIGLLLAGCGERNVYKPPPPPEVTVSRPVRESIIDYLDLTGNTQAIQTVQLRARVVGYLEKVLFNDGDRVKKGQLLFLIQQNTYQAKLQQAEASVLSQQANLDHAQTEYTRYSNLLKQNAASQTDVDQWRYQRDSAKAAVMSAKAARDLAKQDIEYTRVTAPFDGRIDRSLIDAGNLVGAGTASVLAVVNKIDPIYAYFTINERDLLRMMVRTGRSPQKIDQANVPVYLALADDVGYPHVGRVDFVATSITPTTGTLLLRGIFPNPDGHIQPGLFARIRLPATHKRPAILIPQTALGFDQQGDSVLVVGEDNVVQRRSVTPGADVETFRVVMEGLKENEWVVTSGVLRAMPGRPVTPIRKTLSPPATQPRPASRPTSQPGGSSP